MTAVETAQLYLRGLQPTDMVAYYHGIYADPEVIGAHTLATGE